MSFGAGGREERLDRRAMNLLTRRDRHCLRAGFGDDRVAETDRVRDRGMNNTQTLQLRPAAPSVASGRALLEYPVACLPDSLSPDSLSPQHSRYATHRRHVFDPVAGGDVRRGE